MLVHLRLTFSPFLLRISVIFQDARYPSFDCNSNIEITPLRKVDVTRGRKLGDRQYDVVAHAIAAKSGILASAPDGQLIRDITAIAVGSCD